MPPIVAVIQARMGSQRLPGKVLRDVAGTPLLARVVERTRTARQIDELVIAATTAPRDDAIEQLCAQEGWRCFRGSEEDVLDRYYRAAQLSAAHHVVRVTADCPLLCPRELDRVISRHLETAADYSHNITVWGSGMPLGTGGEIFRFEALERSWHEGHEPHHREHVDEYIGDHAELFHIERVLAPPQLHRPELRLTVDTQLDLDLITLIYERLDRPGNILDLQEVIELLDANPDLGLLNRTPA